MAKIGRFFNKLSVKIITSIIIMVTLLTVKISGSFPICVDQPGVLVTGLFDNNSEGDDT